jgi:hypothetical protein
MPNYAFRLRRGLNLWLCRYVHERHAFDTLAAVRSYCTNFRFLALALTWYGHNAEIGGCQ